MQPVDNRDYFLLYLICRHIEKMSEPRNNRQQQHIFWCRATAKPVWFNELPEVGFNCAFKTRN